MFSQVRKVFFDKVLKRNGIREHQLKMIRGIVLLDEKRGDEGERRFYQQLFLKYCLDFHPGNVINVINLKVFEASMFQNYELRRSFSILLYYLYLLMNRPH